MCSKMHCAAKSIVLVAVFFGFCTWCDCVVVASFPGFPLTSTKNRKGRGEPGTDSHVISRHDAFALTVK